MKNQCHLWGLALAFLLLTLAVPARADEAPAPDDTPILDRYAQQAQELVTRALALVGVRYRRGGSSPETGFDCSGFVDHVAAGIAGRLPRTSRELSHTGTKVGRTDLEAGDLVFFNTRRRKFSHVGIYVGESRFIHAPAAGGRVRVDAMTDTYWTKRFNGARRLGL
jgi:cell wall-associated NlpC family hydrolase